MRDEQKSARGDGSLWETALLLTAHRRPVAAGDLAAASGRPVQRCREALAHWHQRGYLRRVAPGAYVQGDRAKRIDSEFAAIRRVAVQGRFAVGDVAEALGVSYERAYAKVSRWRSQGRIAYAGRRHEYAFPDALPEQPRHWHYGLNEVDQLLAQKTAIRAADLAAFAGISWHNASARLRSYRSAGRLASPEPGLFCPVALPPTLPVHA